MTTVKNTDIPVSATQVQLIDRRDESIKPTTLPTDDLLIYQYTESFGSLIGPSPTHSLLLSTTNQSNNPFFHEACVYLPAHEELYITSNLLSANTSSAYPTILISRIKLTRSSSSEKPNNDIESLEWAKLRPPPGIDMPNGGVNYKDGLLFCAQGSPNIGTGGLYYMPRSSPPKPVVTNFYGRDFNSVNDVVVAKDGSLWFTDPCYGYEQGFRRRPELPCQVYRYDVESGEVRVVAEGFDRCNGICFSPEEDKVYITDTGYIHGDGTKDFMRPATVYVFDVETKDGAPFLINRRTFAFSAVHVPDGIKCDVHGNVYSGCGDGIEVWNPAGSLIGRILIPGGAANFCFGKEGEMFICNEQKLWRVQLAQSTKGALLGI